MGVIFCCCADDSSAGEKTRLYNGDSGGVSSGSLGFDPRSPFVGRTPVGGARSGVSVGAAPAGQAGKKNKLLRRALTTDEIGVKPKAQYSTLGRKGVHRNGLSPTTDQLQV